MASCGSLTNTPKSQVRPPAISMQVAWTELALANPFANDTPPATNPLRPGHSHQSHDRRNLEGPPLRHPTKPQVTALHDPAGNATKPQPKRRKRSDQGLRKTCRSGDSYPNSTSRERLDIAASSLTMTTLHRPGGTAARECLRERHRAEQARPMCHGSILPTTSRSLPGDIHSHAVSPR